MRDLKVCVCLWLSLIVLRWTCAVDRLWKSSYCQMFLSALLSGPTQIPHKYSPFGPLSGMALDCQWSPLTRQWCGPWLSVKPPWLLSGVALDCQWSPLDLSVVWPLTVSAALMTPQWCGPWLSVQPPWPHWWSPLTSQWHGPWLSVQPPLFHWWSPLDCSVVWPLTVSAAPLTPQWRGPWLSVQPPWPLSGVALDCQCSPSQLDFVCAAASGPWHDGTDVQEHHTTGAHQLHAELPAGRCHCVWPWARIRTYRWMGEGRGGLCMMITLSSAPKTSRSRSALPGLLTWPSHSILVNRKCW